MKENRNKWTQPYFRWIPWLNWREKKEWIQVVYEHSVYIPHSWMAEQEGKIANKSWTLFVGLFIIVVGVTEFWNRSTYTTGFSTWVSVLTLLEEKYKYRSKKTMRPLRMDWIRWICLNLRFIRYMCIHICVYICVNVYVCICVLYVTIVKELQNVVIVWSKLTSPMDQMWCP